MESARILVGIVGIWWEFGGNGVQVQVKFGWVLTDMTFLPNSNHSYHSTWAESRQNHWGRVKYSYIMHCRIEYLQLVQKEGEEWCALFVQDEIYAIMHVKFVKQVCYGTEIYTLKFLCEERLWLWVICVVCRIAEKDARNCVGRYKV